MAGLVAKWLSSFLNSSSHAQYCGCQQNGVDYQQINADIVFSRGKGFESYGIRMK
jgi:hypothetical protein